MASTRALAGLLLLSLCIIATLIPSNDALSCLPCNLQKCKKPQGCRHGYTKDVCFCCERCAQGPGQDCGGDWGEVGGCADGLTCVTTRGSRRGKCRGKPARQY